jgi:hypothetical protein
MPKSVIIDHLKFKTGALNQYPELASLIAEISNQWNFIEQEMTMLFCYGLSPSEPAISSAVLGCTSNLATKIQMIRTSLSLGVSDECGSAFWKQFEQKIRKAAKPRNIIVHGLWTTHEDHPKGLIRTGGYSDPYGDTQLYEKKDFLIILLSLVELLIALREFSMSLPKNYPNSTSSLPPKYWRFVEPDKQTWHDLDQQEPSDP